MAELRSLIRKVSRTDTDTMFRSMRDNAEVQNIRKASASRHRFEDAVDALAEKAIVIDDGDSFLADMGA